MLCFGRYCLADDRFVEAVKFLDLNDRAGWQLLQVVYLPTFTLLCKRPILLLNFIFVVVLQYQIQIFYLKSSLLAQKHICFFCFLTVHHIS